MEKWWRKTPDSAYVSNLLAEIALSQFYNQLDIKLETNPRLSSFKLFLKYANDDVEAKIAEINW